MSAFARSWNLIKAAWGVLSDDKELIVFPIISAIGAILVTIAFAVPEFLLYSAGGNEALGYVLLFLFYLVQYTVIIFANSALVGAAMIRLRGGNPTLGDGFRLASSRFGAILGYALISATVGIILQALSKRGTLANIVRSLVGMAWNLATYLVVPVLVVENIGPIEAIKRSANLLRRTWGEQIVGGAGMGLVFFLLILLTTVLGGAGVFLGVSLNSTGADHRQHHRRRSRLPYARAAQLDTGQYLLGGGLPLRSGRRSRRAIRSRADPGCVSVKIRPIVDKCLTILSRIFNTDNLRQPPVQPRRSRPARQPASPRPAERCIRRSVPEYAGPGHRHSTIPGRAGAPAGTGELAS